MLDYTVIEGSPLWADKYREFCRIAYKATYVCPERGITENLFNKQVFGSPRIVKLFQEYCQNDNTHKPWLAVDANNNLIGVVCAQLYPDYCDMKAFYVRPDLKGKGIGHALYKKVLDFADSLPIQVDVIEYAVSTIEMYKHWGFEIDNRRASFTYDITEWPKRATENYRAIYMIKPGGLA